MADDELQTVYLRNDFYRDCFPKIVLSITILGAAIFLLTVSSIYLFMSHPAPVVFKTDNDWYLVPDPSVNQPFLNQADLLQWVNTTLVNLFELDFLNYSDHLPTLNQYFTEDGWKKFLVQLNTVVSFDDIRNGKLFINSSPGGAPFVFQQGMVGSRFGWWVQMPLQIKLTNATGSTLQTWTAKVLVLRASTRQHASGVVIDNIILTKGAQGIGNA